MDDKPRGFKPSALTPEQRQDAERLKALFQSRQNGYTQRSFGKAFALGSAGMVSQYINGTRPLNLQAAVKFAQGLDVPLKAISPSLAAKLVAMAPTARLFTR